MKDNILEVMVNAITETRAVLTEMETADERAVVDSDFIMCAYGNAVLALRLSLVYMAENPEALAAYAADGFKSWTDDMIEKFDIMVVGTEKTVPNPFKK